MGLPERVRRGVSTGFAVGAARVTSGAIDGAGPAFGASLGDGGASAGA